MRFTLALILALFGQHAFSQTTVEFSPLGYSKRPTQARAHFSEAVTAFGQSEAESPFQIDCPIKGQSRWVGSQDWVYDFVSEVPGGVRCTFTLIKTKDQQGKAIKAEHSYSFHTGGPQIVRAEPSGSYGLIDEEQIFILELDAPVDTASLPKRLSFQIPQIANQVDAKLLDPEALKKTAPDFARTFPDPGRPFLVIQSPTRFPSDKQIELHWSAGIRSQGGVATEEAQVFRFKTRPEFTASYDCERSSAAAACSPLGTVFLNFSSPLPEDQQKYVQIENLLPSQKIVKNPESWHIEGPHAPNASLRVRFDKALRDDAGRELSSPTSRELLIKFAAYPALVKFAADFGILEAKSNPILPIHLRAVEVDTKVRLYKIPNQSQDIGRWMAKSRRAEAETEILPASLAGRQVESLKRTRGADAFEVLGLPLPKPGFYQVEVASDLLGKEYDKKTFFAHTQVLVTDLAIHWKKSPDSALVWVTSLASGQSVSGAKVQVRNCNNQILAEGTSGADGLVAFKKALPVGIKCENRDAWPYYDALLISAALGDDFSFVFSSDDDGIESWRFGIDSESPDYPSESQKLAVHAILDRPLLRAGETLSFLAVARDKTLAGFAYPGPLKNQVELEHLGSEKRYSTTLTWDKLGRGQGSFRIPDDAPLGNYELRVQKQVAARFRVGQFRVATVKAELNASTRDPVQPSNVAYDFNVSYLNGGGSGSVPVSMRAELFEDRGVPVADYKDYSFSLGPYREREGADPKLPKIEKISSKLDAAGHGHVQVPVPQWPSPLTMQVELEFPDANGELRTQSAVTHIWPADLLLGLKASTRWPRMQEKFTISGVLLDLQQKPLQGRITLSKRLRQVFSHRRRGIGGTYTYEHKVILGEPSPLCAPGSNPKGEFSCELSLPEPGQYIVEAEAQDGEKRKLQTYLEFHVAGKQDWYEASDHDRIDLIPDKKVYEPGDRAKIQIVAPFPQASMLVSVEREGIESYEVKAFDAKNPYIEIPIARQHAPNTFVSVWLFRGRTKGSEPFLKVDLGKPAYRLGIVALKVGRREHTLDVTVKSDRSEYLTRDKAKLSIEVKAPGSQTLPENAIVTIAVVDEGLLELESNPSWDLLEAMLGQRPYRIRHATAAMHVMGKRHFGLKALAAGGGGGRGGTRELFETLLLWKGAVPVKDGKASVDVPLNDSLSSFRAVAIAQAGPDLFGKAETSFATRKDLSLFAGLPPAARQGDLLQAVVTVRNSSKQASTVKVRGKTDFGLDLPEQSLNLPAQSAQKVSWPVKIPDNAQQVVYSFDVESPDFASDSLRIVQSLKAAIPLQTLQAEILPMDPNAPLILPVEAPQAAQKAQGGIDIRISSSLLRGALDAPKLFMRDYPYSCLEQQMSRAIVLDDAKLWKKIEASLGRYADANGLLRYFPQGDRGSVELTSLALEYSKRRGWELSEATFNSLREALMGALNGRIPWSGYEGEHLLVMKLRAAAGLAISGDLSAELLANLDIKPELLPLAALIDLYSITQKTPDHPLKTRTESALEQRLEMRGTVMQVKAAERDYSLLASQDASVARMLLTAYASGAKRDSQVPLTRAFLASRSKGLWDTTVGNALGTLVLRAFSETFEKVPVSGESEVSLEERLVKVERDSAQALSLPWPQGKAELKAQHKGAGAPWLSVLSRAALPILKPITAGFTLTKTLKAVESKNPNQVSVGDIYEVELSFSSRANQEWVSVFDPIPTGARVLPSTLADASYTEASFQGLTAYFERFYAGEQSLKYRFQINNAGEFQLPPSRIEAMYNPEVFALLPNAPWNIP